MSLPDFKFFQHIAQAADHADEVGLDVWQLTGRANYYVTNNPRILRFFAAHPERYTLAYSQEGAA